MNDTLLLLFALVVGWLILAGCGELWFKFFCNKNNKFTGGSINSQRDKITCLSLCRSLSALPVILILWSLENIQGLGTNLSLLLAPVLIASILIYLSNWRQASWEEKKTRILLETCFGISIVYVFWLFWGNSDIAGTIDRGGDLLNTVTMASGETLPPTHPWLPPFKAEDYYRGQWYAGGLLARLCNLSPGHNYFSSYMLCVAWINSCVLLCAWILTKQKITPSVASLLVIVLGGHFGPLILHISTAKSLHPQKGGNIVGVSMSSHHHSRITELNTFGVIILKNMEAETKKMKPEALTNEIPCEPYAYHISMGDWHSWFGSYLVLAIMLTAIAAFITSRGPPNSMLSCIILGILTPSVFLFNTWTAPILVVCIVTTLGLGMLYKSTPIKNLTVFVISAIITTSVVIMPLTYILRAKEYGTIAAFKLLALREEATFIPYLGWLIYFGGVTLWVIIGGLSAFRLKSPLKIETYLWVAAATTLTTLLLVKVHTQILKSLDDNSTLYLGSNLIPSLLIATPTFFTGLYLIYKLKKLKVSANMNLALTSSWIFAALYIFCETFFVQDYLGYNKQIWQRFNTANKWLPSTLIILTSLSAPLALNSKITSLKISAYLLAALVIIPTTYNIITHRYPTKTSYNGTTWIKKSNLKTVYENLLKLPKGVVLEYQHPDLSFNTPNGMIPLHTNHYSFLGWRWGHLSLWYPSLRIIEDRLKQSVMFYEGTLENPTKWAKENGIDYIIWSTSLQENFNGYSYAPPPLESWNMAWEKNNNSLQEDYIWLVDEPHPRKEGMWVRKNKISSIQPTPPI
jgi:hypothetical protein